MHKPGTVRFTIEGTMDGTYGPGVFYNWQGEIRVDATPAAGYGSLANLKATLVKRQGLGFVDHWGDNYLVHIVGEMPEKYLTPDWAGSLGIIQVRITGVAPSPSASVSPSASASPSASPSPSA